MIFYSSILEKNRFLHDERTWYVIYSGPLDGGVGIRLWGRWEDLEDIFFQYYILKFHFVGTFLLRVSFSVRTFNWMSLKNTKKCIRIKKLFHTYSFLRLAFFRKYECTKFLKIWLKFLKFLETCKKERLQYLQGTARSGRFFYFRKLGGVS